MTMLQIGRLYVVRWQRRWSWSVHRCDVCSWRVNLGKIAVGWWRR